MRERETRGDDDVRAHFLDRLDHLIRIRVGGETSRHQSFAGKPDGIFPIGGGNVEQKRAVRQEPVNIGDHSISSVLSHPPLDGLVIC